MGAGGNDIMLWCMPHVWERNRRAALQSKPGCVSMALSVSFECVAQGVVCESVCHSGSLKEQMSHSQS